MKRTLHSPTLFFFNDPATTEIYTLSLHDALPISLGLNWCNGIRWRVGLVGGPPTKPDRKSTRLNSSHGSISYAVFCSKKKKGRTSACVPGTAAGDAWLWSGRGARR